MFDFPLSTTSSFPKPPTFAFTNQNNSRKNDLSARHWHNRYLAWQVRERRQAEERQKLEAEQRRIFGGESGERDEDGLCKSMMEFFGTLDFIDNYSCQPLGP